MRRFRRFAPSLRSTLTSNTSRQIVPWYDSAGDDAAGVKYYVKNVTCKDIFSMDENRGLFFQYSEVKFHSIRAYYVTDFSTADNGSYALVVCDAGEANFDFSKYVVGRFGYIASMPGAIVKRSWQNASNIWHPTEPSDRDWRLLDSVDPIFQIALAPSGPLGCKGSLIVKISVSLRGRGQASLAKHAFSLLEKSGYWKGLASGYGCKSSIGSNSKDKSTSSGVSKLLDEFDHLEMCSGISETSSIVTCKCKH